MSGQRSFVRLLPGWLVCFGRTTFSALSEIMVGWAINSSFDLEEILGQRD